MNANKCSLDFQFTVTEIKRLGKGLGMNLSLRMEGEYEGSGHCSSANHQGEEPPARFTLHAVVPYDPTFAPIQIGQKFRLEKVKTESLISKNTWIQTNLMKASC